VKLLRKSKFIMLRQRSNNLSINMRRKKHMSKLCIKLPRSYNINNTNKNTKSTNNMSNQSKLHKITNNLK
jgi:hypothetical protein